MNADVEYSKYIRPIYIWKFSDDDNSGQQGTFAGNYCLPKKLFTSFYLNSILNFLKRVNFQL